MLNNGPEAERKHISGLLKPATAALLQWCWSNTSSSGCTALRSAVGMHEWMFVDASMRSCIHIFNSLPPLSNSVVISAAQLFIKTMCGKNPTWSTFKETCLPLCEALYRIDADVLFVRTLHLIHYRWPAREIVESESIQRDRDRARCSSELSMN